MLIIIAVPNQIDIDTKQQKNEAFVMEPQKVASDLQQPSRTQPNVFAKDHKSNATELLTEITRLTVAIKDAESQSKATAYDNKADLEDHQVLRLHLESVFISSPTKNDKQAIGGEAVSYTAESGKTLTDVQKRLIEANLRRRSRFLNAHRHANMPIYMGYVRKPDNSTSIIKRRKAFELDVVPTTIPTDDSINMSEIPSLEGSEALYGVNTIFSRSDGDTRDQQTFKCPWCCKELPDTIKKDTTWE
jgi:hypothetical protein